MAEAGRLGFDELRVGQAVRMGQRIGTMKRASAHAKKATGGKTKKRASKTPKKTKKRSGAKARANVRA